MGNREYAWLVLYVLVSPKMSGWLYAIATAAAMVMVVAAEYEAYLKRKLERMKEEGNG